eukprot:TRINITY_DN17255_c0_g1_i1.p1 TRINITY_DN17255_c0_g1~~TRINITY_DN17255_c0_g1_i1.p1  ORF type:complete len:297 (-),score=50.94 TRINITY_DN17255_c0_g1_i1:20-910(-)
MLHVSHLLIMIFMYLVDIVENLKKKFLDDIQKFDTVSLKWTKLNPKGENPLGRYGATLCGKDGFLYLFGGWTVLGRMNELFRYSIKENRWIKLLSEGFAPPERCYHTAIIFRDDIYIYGGSSDKSKQNDMLRYSIENNKWNCVEYKNERNYEIPLPTRNHSASIYSNSMIIFGGQNEGTGISKKMYAFQFDEGRWEKIQVTNKPKSRRSHISFVHNKKLYVFGGYNSKTLADMYTTHIILSSWNPKSHQFYPISFSNLVFPLLLIYHSPHCVFGLLPTQVLFPVLRWLSKLSNCVA